MSALPTFLPPVVVPAQAQVDTTAPFLTNLQVSPKIVDGVIVAPAVIAIAPSNVAAGFIGKPYTANIADVEALGTQFAKVGAALNTVLQLCVQLAERDYLQQQIQSATDAADRVAKLTQQQQQQTNRLAGLNAQLARLNAQAAQAAGTPGYLSPADLATHTAALNPVIATDTARLTALTSELTAAQTNATSLAAQVAGWQASIATIEASLR
jgi:hypothetical protein